MPQEDQPGDLRVNCTTDERQLIAAIRATIATGFANGDTSGAILRAIESLLAGVETFREHIDRVSRCGACARPIEHVAGIKDPFWRHIGAAGFVRSHAARSADDLPRNPHGGLDLAASDASVGLVDTVRRATEDGDPGAVVPADVEGIAPTTPARNDSGGGS